MTHHGHAPGGTALMQKGASASATTNTTHARNRHRLTGIGMQRCMALLLVRLHLCTACCTAHAVRTLLLYRTVPLRV